VPRQVVHRRKSFVTVSQVSERGRLQGNSLPAARDPQFIVEVLKVRAVVG